jgi:hypothetical protein
MINLNCSSPYNFIIMKNTLKISNSKTQQQGGGGVGGG